MREGLSVCREEEKAVSNEGTREVFGVEEGLR
jgi:hypothetical protein